MALSFLLNTGSMHPSNIQLGELLTHSQHRSGDLHVLANMVYWKVGCAAYGMKTPYCEDYARQWCHVCCNVRRSMASNRAH